MGLVARLASPRTTRAGTDGLRDSPLERNGFERSVPRQIGNSAWFRPSWGRSTGARSSEQRTDRVVGRGPGRRHSPPSEENVYFSAPSALAQGFFPYWLLCVRGTASNISDAVSEEPDGGVD
jgi:hypothetical protein